MPTDDLERAVKRLRSAGYAVEKTQSGYVSADGYIMRYTVGQGLASDDDIMRIANGLDHLPEGVDFAVGQAVQFITALSVPANIPAGAVATVEQTGLDEVTIRKGNKLVRVARSAIAAFPPPERHSRKR